MKKFLIIIAVFIASAAVLLPLEHYYCDNIYALAAFSKAPVIEVDKNVYRCAKDDYKILSNICKVKAGAMLLSLARYIFLKKGIKLSAVICR